MAHHLDRIYGAEHECYPVDTHRERDRKGDRGGKGGGFAFGGKDRGDAFRRGFGRDPDARESQMDMFKSLEREYGCCPFYLKIGACRHGDQCSRLHNRPVSSNTLLLQHVYPVPEEGWRIAAEDCFEDNDYDAAQAHLEEFYDEMFAEMWKYGEVKDMLVVDNISEHMFGNVYVQYYREEDWERAMQKLAGRHYAGKLIKAEFSPVVDFRDARCRMFHETICNRGGFCNFMHIKHIPRWNKMRLLREMYEDYPFYDSKNYKAALKRFKEERAAERKMQKDQTVPVSKPRRALTLDAQGQIIEVPRKRAGDNYGPGGNGGDPRAGGQGPPGAGGWHGHGPGGAPGAGHWDPWAWHQDPNHPAHWDPHHPVHAWAHHAHMWHMHAMHGQHHPPGPPHHPPPHHAGMPPPHMQPPHHAAGAGQGGPPHVLPPPHMQAGGSSSSSATGAGAGAGGETTPLHGAHVPTPGGGWVLPIPAPGQASLHSQSTSGWTAKPEPAVGNPEQFNAVVAGNQAGSVQNPYGNPYWNWDGKHTTPPPQHTSSKDPSWASTGSHTLNSGMSPMTESQSAYPNGSDYAAKMQLDTPLQGMQAKMETQMDKGMAMGMDKGGKPFMAGMIPPMGKGMPPPHPV